MLGPFLEPRHSESFKGRIHTEGVINLGVVGWKGLWIAAYAVDPKKTLHLGNPNIRDPWHRQFEPRPKDPKTQKLKPLSSEPSPSLCPMKN